MPGFVVWIIFAAAVAFGWMVFCEERAIRRRNRKDRDSLNRKVRAAVKHSFTDSGVPPLLGRRWDEDKEGAEARARRELRALERSVGIGLDGEPDILYVDLPEGVRAEVEFFQVAGVAPKVRIVGPAARNLHPDRLLRTLVSDHEARIKELDAHARAVAARATAIAPAGHPCVDCGEKLMHVDPSRCNDCKAARRRETTAPCGDAHIMQWADRYCVRCGQPAEGTHTTDWSKV